MLLSDHEDDYSVNFYHTNKSIYGDSWHEMSKQILWRQEYILEWWTENEADGNAGCYPDAPQVDDSDHNFENAAADYNLFLFW